MFDISDHLLLTLSMYAVSVAVLLIVGFFVFFQNPSRLVNRLFLFLAFTLSFFSITFIGASLQVEYTAAYRWWFLSIANVLIPMASVHILLAVIDKHREWKWFIRMTYFIGIAIFFAALFEPRWFLLDVSPKLYFHFYRESGWLGSLMMVYFVLFPVVALVRVWVARASALAADKIRYDYYLLSFFFGFTSGLMSYLLVVGIPVDPIFGSVLGFSFIPMAYGIYAHNLLHVRIAVGRALYYAIGVAGIASLLTAVTLLNTFFVETLPFLHFWTIPIVVSVITVVIWRSIWVQLKETDQLKYEFITIAAHKLRTPLTRIRWEIPTLLELVGDNQKVKEGLVRIDVANNRLIELTSILMEASHTEDVAYVYKKDLVDLSVAITNAVARFESQIKEKNLSVVVAVDPQSGRPVGDSGRLASVVDVMVENAVIYNKDGGSIHIALRPEGADRVRFEVSDTGIGVSAEDAGRIFNSFYRTDAAKRVDTEGVGIGLSVAKNIIEKHEGRVGVASLGDTKGSTFWFTLPV